MVEEVWIESTQGFPTELIGDIQQINPMIRFKANGSVIGRAYFISRKQFLWSLRMARRGLMYRTRPSDTGKFMIACIGWNKKEPHDQVETLVSIITVL